MSSLHTWNTRGMHCDSCPNVSSTWSRCVATWSYSCECRSTEAPLRRNPTFAFPKPTAPLHCSRHGWRTARAYCLYNYTSRQSLSKTCIWQSHVSVCCCRDCLRPGTFRICLYSILLAEILTLPRWALGPCLVIYIRKMRKLSRFLISCERKCWYHCCTRNVTYVWSCLMILGLCREVSR